MLTLQDMTYKLIFIASYGVSLTKSLSLQRQTKKTLDIGIYKCSKEFYESGKQKTKNVLTAYKEKIQGQNADDVTEFINNYYFEDTL